MSMANKSQFTWEVPEIFYPSEARIRLVYFYYNDNGISYSDTSNSFFLPGNLQSPIIEILNLMAAKSSKSNL